MEIKHWSREGKAESYVADELLQRHAGVLFLLGKIIAIDT